MDLDTITLNECTNDGTMIHLYNCKESELWECFGVSALAVHRFSEQTGMNCIESFSYKLQMPFMLIKENELQALMTQSGLLSEKHQSYIRILTDQTIDQAEYMAWTTALRQA